MCFKSNSTVHAVVLTNLDPQSTPPNASRSPVCIGVSVFVDAYRDEGVVEVIFSVRTLRSAPESIQQGNFFC